VGRGESSKILKKMRTVLGEKQSSNQRQSDADINLSTKRNHSSPKDPRVEGAALKVTERDKEMKKKLWGLTSILTEKPAFQKML